MGYLSDDELTTIDPTTVTFTGTYDEDGWFYFDVILSDDRHVQSGEYAHECNAQVDLDYVRNDPNEIRQFLNDFQFNVKEG